MTAVATAGLFRRRGSHDMDHYADDLAALTSHLDLKNAIHVAHSTGGGEVVHYLARHGESRVAKAVLIGAVPPLMVKTAAHTPTRRARKRMPCCARSSAATILSPNARLRHRNIVSCCLGIGSVLGKTQHSSALSRHRSALLRASVGTFGPLVASTRIQRYYRSKVPG